MTDVITHTSRRINAIGKKIKLSRYLEIGVETGRTFFGINIDHKVAVDPRFLFDPSEYQSDCVELLSTTSDDFFNGYKGPKFDLIYIDGLHLFEQVFRDFTNALALTSQVGVVIVDDVFPSDVFSSFRDWNDAMELRRRLGGSSGDWHGDVYKMLFMVHDFFPSLSYAIVDDGSSNKQLVVWKKQRVGFENIFNDMTQVSEATYFDLIKYEDRFRIMGEDELVALLSEDLMGLGAFSAEHDCA
ncbi:class I SAM-dependent methyltransferase [Methylobacterium sp. J-068]|uniref:class I SAM-dependent methyltransferase n=1 Tax=Methylobacterium sp. J-068 TaxID=2836649 RepID=UPI001FBB905F|nr:class I SAM-dependent methyltransferase [Methylobacterium sp. J-068]MCJ2033438.1 class I SAM-dependent methyltransferase [Methylobacterium sp. J-068]